MIDYELICWIFLTHLENQKDGQSNEINYNDQHWENEQWLSSKTIDQWYDDDRSNNVDDTSQDDSVLNLVWKNSGIFENAFRVEEDGVDTAELLSELENETCNQWPSQFFWSKQLFERNVLIRFGFSWF